MAFSLREYLAKELAIDIQPAGANIPLSCDILGDNLLTQI